MSQGTIRKAIKVGSSSLGKRDLLTYPMSVNTPRDVTAGGETAPSEPRRWVRDADELCVLSVHRSNNINKINNFVATYKFNDPQWQPFLFPEVVVGSPSSSSSVVIDYNKASNLELVSRHANYALRHLVQKGHAMYFVTYSQHSILEMRGLVESSYITCSYGVRGERLRTHLIHVGPLDVRDVLEVDSKEGSSRFNFQKPNIRRGVVALSLVEGYGTWFQRKPMLWQRTRRIGALQSAMGAYDYDMLSPEEVGRSHPHEVSLLRSHSRFMGGTAGGGCEAVGIIASSQVAENKKLYLGQFEAPAIAAIDSVQQLAHYSALHHRLVSPRDPASSAQEQFLPVSWVTRTPPPYVPLESDLPFKVQLSQPNVFTATEERTVYPTGGTVGSPFVQGVPLTLQEYHIHQGVDHYVFDDSPSSRPLKWWNQKSNLPYNGYLYSMRSGLLDYVRPAENFENPLAPPKSSAAFRRTSSLTQRLKRQRRKRPERAPEAEGELGGAVLEEQATASGDLVGHDLESRQQEAEMTTTAEKEEQAVRERGHVHNIVPPTAKAQRRLSSYTLKRNQKGPQAEEEAEAVSLGTASNRLLKRRLRKLKKKKNKEE